MSTTNTNVPATQEDMGTYLASVADRLQSKVDEASNQMSKKIEEMAKRIDTLERNLKQMEPPANPISEEEE